jgi:hypothetical protein
MKIRVMHRGYGCDTGCCGHVIEVDGVEYRKKGGERFHFDHPDDTSQEAAKRFAEDLIRQEMGEEHVADLDWENCEVFYD